jgi:hypothetical protein
VGRRMTWQIFMACVQLLSVMNPPRELALSEVHRIGFELPSDK